jgi:hypothetical protein
MHAIDGDRAGERYGKAMGMPSISGTGTLQVQQRGRQHRAAGSELPA